MLTFAIIDHGVGIQALSVQARITKHLAQAAYAPMSCFGERQDTAPACWVKDARASHGCKEG